MNSERNWAIGIFLTSWHQNVQGVTSPRFLDLTWKGLYLMDLILETTGSDIPEDWETISNQNEEFIFKNHVFQNKQSMKFDCLSWVFQNENIKRKQNWTKIQTIHIRSLQKQIFSSFWHIS